MGEVTPPGLRGEGEDRVRGYNLGRMRMVMLIVMIVVPSSYGFGVKAF